MALTSQELLACLRSSACYCMQALPLPSSFPPLPLPTRGISKSSSKLFRIYRSVTVAGLDVIAQHIPVPLAASLAIAIQKPVDSSQFPADTNILDVGCSESAFANADEDTIVKTGPFYIPKLSNTGAIRLFADCCQFIFFLGPLVSAIGSL